MIDIDVDMNNLDRTNKQIAIEFVRNENYIVKFA